MAESFASISLVKRVCLVASVFLLIPSLAPIVNAEVVIEERSNHVGDWFEYDGYGNSLAIAMANQYAQIDGADFVGWTLVWDELLRVEVTEKATCDIGEWSGTCLRTVGVHHLNITLQWAENTTQYDDDKLLLNVTSEIHSESPFSTSTWHFEQRRISLRSWFSGDDEMNMVETETTTKMTPEESNPKPKIIEKGDTWQSSVTIQKRDEMRQRINLGMWNESLSEREETQTIVYTVEDEASVNTAKENWQTLRLRQQGLGEDNYSISYLSEFGWPIRTEEYENGTLTMSMTLSDFHSATISGVKETSVETPSLGIIGVVATLYMVAVIIPKKRLS